MILTMTTFTMDTGYRMNYALLVSVLLPILTNGQLFTIRLVGGSNATNGRVEVSNGLEFGTICDDKWEDQDATVACRMLGYSRGIALVSVNGVPPFGSGTGRIVLDDVTCFGPDTNLGQCQHRGWGITDCTHAEDAGVQCIGASGGPPLTSTRRPVTPGPVPNNCPGGAPSPNLRLYGTIPGIGIVETFNPTTNDWGGICDDGFGLRDAIVVCRMLCYDIRYARPGAREDMVQATPRLPIKLDKLACTSNENAILDCPSSGWGIENCNDTTEAVRVTCIPQDYLAPPPPIPTVVCTNSMLLASFNRSNYPDIEDKHLDVNNAPASCNVQKRTTTTTTQIAIPFDQCDTVRELNATHIVYKNTVRIASTYLQNNVIRKNTYLIYIACDFPRSGAVDDQGIQPLTETVSQRAPGRYNFEMKFYRYDNLSQPVTTFPILINLGEFLNVGISLEDVDSGLKLIVPNCRASPTQNPGVSVNYPLIADKCPSDPALALFPWNRTTFAFRFQTIKFVGNSPQFYVTCDTFVCTISEKNADCDQTCGTPSSTGKRRKKRQAAHHTMYHVSGGPFQIVSSDPVGAVQSPPVQIRPITTTTSRAPITATTSRTGSGSVSPHPEPPVTSKPSPSTTKMSDPATTTPPLPPGTISTTTPRPQQPTVKSSQRSLVLSTENRHNTKTRPNSTFTVVPMNRTSQASSRYAPTTTNFIDATSTSKYSNSEEKPSQTRLKIRVQDVVGVLGGSSSLSSVHFAFLSAIIVIVIILQRTIF